MKIGNQVFYIAGCFLVLGMLSGCAKKADKTVKTITVRTLGTQKIDFSKAISGGVIDNQWNLPVTQTGICYDTVPGPTLSSSVIYSTNATDSFGCTLSGLIPGNRYYIRAFAKNDAGTYYGNEVVFNMDLAAGIINYDIGYSPVTGVGYGYHVLDFMYIADQQTYTWWTIVYSNHDTLYRVEGLVDSFGVNKGCVALVSSMDPSLQPSYPYYIGSYYKFCLFNDTTLGNLQFMIPTDSFPTKDSILGVGQPGGISLNFKGGLHSFYNGMTLAEAKIYPSGDFVRFGDNFSYANPLIPAQGNIDSVEAVMFIRRFSDNGIHPNPKIINTMDGHFSLVIHLHDGSYLTIYNGDFINLPFQKTPM